MQFEIYLKDNSIPNKAKKVDSGVIANSRVMV